jgi:hypothetical protein
MENGSLFSLGRETINSNRWLLFQQACPSMVISYHHWKHVWIKNHWQF